MKSGKRVRSTCTPRMLLSEGSQKEGKQATVFLLINKFVIL